MIYIVWFSISIWFSFILGKVKGKLWLVCFAQATLIPAVLIGVRSENLGVDMRLYGSPVWNIAQGLKEFDFSRTAYSTSVEKSYLFLNYVFSRFFTDVHWLLFFLAFVSCGLVLYVLHKSDYPKVAWLGYMYYLFIFFPRSVNLVRQGFSIAFLFAATHFFLKKKWIMYVFFVVVAYLLHHSAVIALLLPLISWYMKGKNKKLKSIGLISFCLLGVLSFKFWGKIILFFGDKYTVYLDGSYKPHFTLFSLMNIPFIAFILVYLKKLKLFRDYASLILAMLIVGLCFAQMSMISVYLIRISTFFDLFAIWAAMMIFSFTMQNINDQRKKKLSYVFLTLYPIVFFVGYFLLTGQGNVYPYESELLDYLMGKVL